MKNVHNKTNMCIGDQCCKCHRQVPVFDSRDLFAGAKEVRLQHCNEEYRLLKTKSNKLILIK